jgi:hypothetical protein
MNDPLSEVITLLQPRAVFSRRISGAGRWGVAYSAFGHPSFCAVLRLVTFQKVVDTTFLIL